MSVVSLIVLIVVGFLALVVLASLCSTLLIGRRPCKACTASGKGESRLVGTYQDWSGASPMVMDVTRTVYRRDKCQVCRGRGTVPKGSPYAARLSRR
jgi:hypothetical protein